MLSPWTKKWVSMGKYAKYNLLNEYIFIFSLTQKGEFSDSIVDVNEKLDGMNSMNKTIESNLMIMEAMNKSVEDNSLGLKVLNSTMGNIEIAQNFTIYP